MNRSVRAYESHVGTRCVDVRRFANFLNNSHTLSGGADSDRRRRIVPQPVASYDGSGLNTNIPNLGEGQKKGLQKGIELAYYRALKDQYPNKSDQEIMTMVKDVHDLPLPNDHMSDDSSSDGDTTETEEEVELPAPARSEEVPRQNEPEANQGVEERLDRLDNRVNQLERRVFGHASPTAPRRAPQRAHEPQRKRQKQYNVMVIPKTQQCDANKGYAESRIKLKDPALKKCKKTKMRKNFEKYRKKHPNMSFEDYKRQSQQKQRATSIIVPIGADGSNGQNL